MTSKTTFREGEEVIYPNHGLCVIQNIKQETIGGISDTFYNVKVIETGSSLFIPSGNLFMVGLRYPLQKAAVERILSQINDDDIHIYSKWKNRYEDNLKLINTGTPENMVKVLKSLFYVAARKTLSFREKKMQEKVLFLLASEIAHTLKQDVDATIERLSASLSKTMENFISKQG
jgi:CarD family transcriptional regulator